MRKGRGGGEGREDGSQIRNINVDSPLGGRGSEDKKIGKKPSPHSATASEGKRGVVDAFSRLDLISAARDMYVLCVWGFAVPTQKRIRILSYIVKAGKEWICSK